MPKDKSASHIKVLKAIRDEFIEKGYEEASIRSIAQRADMSSAGLYRHYKDKEDMFAAVVQPLIEQMKEWMERHTKQQYSLVDKNEGKDALYGENLTNLIIEVIFPNKAEFKLLLSQAKGSRYENFIHDFVKEQQGELAGAIHYMKEQGYPACELDEEELHMLLSAYVSAVFEPIIHDYSEEKTKKSLKTINEFFMPGWVKIMGL